MNYSDLCFQISHLIIRPLRHNTNFQGLNKENGWANLKELYDYIKSDIVWNEEISWEKFIKIIYSICYPTNKREKIRFQIETKESHENWQIRALEKHTIETINIHKNYSKSYICYQISHAITKPLRHNTYFRGLNRQNGWANLRELYNYIRIDLSWEKFIEIIIIICNPTDENKKIRFQIETEKNNDNWRIRALQGHSINSIIIDNYEIVTDLTITLIHGTPKINILNIREEGLKRFNRNHIHFVSINSPTLKQHMIDRKAEVYLLITVNKLLKNGFKVLRSLNNVYLVCEDCIPYNLFEELDNL